MLSTFVRRHHEYLASFLGRLQGTPEGEGTLLDNSTILHGSSLADGHEHAAKNLPLEIARVV